MQEKTRTFTLQFYKKYQVPHGRGLYATGNVAELGNWDIKKAVKLFWLKGDNWRQEVLVKLKSLPLLIEYKFVEMDYDNPDETESTWQPGSNTRVKIDLESLKEVKKPSISCMTYNIRTDKDNIPGKTWNCRKAAVLEMLKTKRYDFVGVQEAQYHQFRYLDTLLENYQSYGRGRGVENADDEFVPIYFNFVKWKLIEANISWFSNTPQVPGSKELNSSSHPRIMTWGIFRHVLHAKLVLVINTHLDHVSEASRAMAVERIKNLIFKIKKSRSVDSIILMGDFNMTKGSNLYKTLIGLMQDCSPVDNYKGTLHGYHSNKTNHKMVDFIFMSEDGSVCNYEVLEKKFYNTVLEKDIFPSDHHPVLAEISFSWLKNMTDKKNLESKLNIQSSITSKVFDVTESGGDIKYLESPDKISKSQTKLNEIEWDTNEWPYEMGGLIIDWDRTVNNERFDKECAASSNIMAKVLG